MVGPKAAKASKPKMPNHPLQLNPQLRQLNTASLASPQSPVCNTTLNGLNCVTENSVGNVNLRVPYLGYSSVGVQQEGYDGNSRFNSLQITVRKRMSHGFSMQAAYTMSSLFTDLSTNNSGNSNNPSDLRQQWGRSAIYRPNRLAINYSWTLPVGALGSSKAGSALFKGWNLSGVTTIQDGQPLTLGDNRGGTVFSSIQAFSANITPRAELCPGLTYANIPTGGSTNSRVGLDAGSTRYLNPASFCLPQLAPNLAANSGNPRLYGNTGITPVQGPGQLNFDASFIKTNRVGGLSENATVQFRAEFYNVFNHTQFSNPNLRTDLGNFGQITSTSVAPRLIQFGLKYVF